VPDGRRHLTPVLRSGGDVRGASKVGPLPGINATSYAGFFEVNATAHAEHFFWHWPALNGNASAPVLVWLQGGPGSSSLFGMFVESGPFSLDAALNPHWRASTWATEYNVVYLDNPRMTGYSYSDSDALCTDWQCYAADFDSWLAQFITAFGFEQNDVYVTGESYGGHYVPAAAFAVMQNNAAGRLPAINLAGVAIGNGFVAPYEMQQGYPDIIFNAGLISIEDYEVARNYSARITEALNADDYVSAYLIWDAFLNGDSTRGGAWFTNVTGLTNYFNIASELPPDFNYFTSYVTSAAVRAAIGVGNAKYNDGNLAVELALVGDVLFSQKPRVEALLQAGKKVLIYNGALDIICGAPLTERYLPLLEWQGAAAWAQSQRALWHDKNFPGGAISGYSRAAQNLLQVVIRGAGHMAPFDQPYRSLDMISRFVDGRDFD
jgi:vitellogenic carboxypeptidase-like protein